MKWSLACLVVASAQPWMDVTESPEERAKKLVSAMTLEEKLSLFHGSCDGYTGNVCGIARLGVPQQKFNDGPQGFRGDAGTSTQWPAALTVAASFDVELMRSYAAAMGDEFYRKGANVQLGPGMCLARVPVNGRNFEYLSGEDPFLGYHMAKASVEGIQSQGVIANAKHFIDNNQETRRGDFIASVDERTQFEMYYPPFQGAIDAGVGSIMCSYNKECIDCDDPQQGRWSCENHDSLTRDLKGRMGFKGWVMSDWGGTHSASMNAGLDQEMPGSFYMGVILAEMVKSGEVSMEKVDDSAVRNMWPYFAMGIFDKVNPNSPDNNVTSPEHNDLARKLSSQSTVLLKNEGVLPLSKGNIVVVGDEAQFPVVGGGGSGSVEAYQVSAPWAALRSHLDLPPPAVPKSNCSDGVFEQDVDYYNSDEQSEAAASSVEECCSLCTLRSACNAFTFTNGQCWMKADSSNRRNKTGAVSGICKKDRSPPSYDCKNGVCVKFLSSTEQDLAKQLADADAAIVFGATNSGEGADRQNLALGDADALIERVAAIAGQKTVVVAVTPAALLTPWRERVGAILMPFLPGQEYGGAIVDVLFGEVNPGAKLPITLPNAENEVGFEPQMYPGEQGVSVYSEGLQVGYRWYNTNGVKPAFAFGHGLSYTSFEYSALAVAGRNVSFTVKNTGARSGSEVPQLYLGFPAVAQEPPKQLKGFSKLNLPAGAATQVSFQLTDRDLSIWDVQSHDWQLVPGYFRVMVGSSSEDIRLTGSLQSAILI